MAAVLEHITEDTQINDAVHSDVAIGDAHPDRQVVVVLNSRGTEPTAMTVGSVSARRQKHEGFGSNFDASIWVADVPFGRTADITITGGDRYTAINVYRGVNVELYDAATDGGGGVDDSVAVTVDSGDASTVAGYHQEGAGGSITSWTGVTERSDASIDAGDADDTYSFADTLDDSTAGSLTVTATSTSSQAASALVAATFRSANVAREIAVESTESGTSFACPQGTNLLVVVTADGAAQTGITYGGVSLTNVSAAVSGTASYAEVWVLKRPPVNSTLTLAGMTGEYYSVCLSGVDLKSAIEVAENSSISTALTSFETQLGSLSDEVFLLDAFRLDSQVTPSVGAGQTSIETGSTADPEGWGFSYKTVDTAAFDSMSWTFASADEPAHAVAAFQPQRLKSPAYQYEEVEGTLSRIDFNYEANDQGPYRSRWTKESNPTFASGIATFDGVDDYLDGPAFDFAGNGIFTFSLWARTTTIFGDDCYFSVHGSTNNTYAMLTNSNGKVRVVFRNSTSNIATSTSLVNDGDWHHIVGMGDGSTVKIFIDGVLEGTATITASAFTPTGSRIGSRNSFNPEYYPGDMADVRIFNRPLTNVEVSDLYARGENNLPVRRKWDSDPDLLMEVDPRNFAGDRSGQGNLVSIENSGELGLDGAFVLDDTITDTHIDTGMSTDGVTDGDYTASFWMNCDDIDANTTMKIFHDWDTGGGATRSFLIRLSSSNLQFYVAGAGSTLTGNCSASFSAYEGEWTHIAATHDASTNGLELFVNGESFDTATYTGTAGTSGSDTIHLGNGTGSGEDLGARITGAKFYKRLRTNAEIKEEMKLTDPRLNLNSDPPQRRQLHGCIGHWMAATEGRDLSGNGNPLGYEDGATVNGGAFEFDGGNYWYSTSASVDLPLTLALWVRADVASSMAFISSSSNSSAYIGTSTLDRYRFGWNGITQSLISIPSPVDGWHHVAQTIDAAGNSTYYIDGEEVGTGTGGTSGAHTLQLGKVSSFGATMDGAQDDIQVYNRALTNGEVTALYQSGVPYYERPERRKLTGEAFHISASEGAVQLSDGAGVTYNGDVSIVDNEYEFDGTGDFITTDYQFKPPFTILTWLDTDQTSSIAVAIGTEENSRTRIGTTTLNRWMFEWSSASSMLINGATTGLHLLALTVDSSGNAEAFADGVSIGTSTGASTSTSTLKIGRTFTTTTQDWDGSIADVKVYERVLNPEEIAIEYNNGTSGYEPSVNHLEAPYQAGGRWCPTITGDATDATDNGNNGTLTNGATTTTDYEDHGEAAFSTDGVNDYIAVSDIEAMDAVSEATWSVNFNPDAWDNNDFVIEKGGVFLLGKHASITPNEGGFAISDGAWNAVNFSSAPTLGEWLPAVATFDNGTLELFASGTSQGTLTGIGSIVNTTSAFNIAGRDTSFPFNGLSDDVMFLPRASHQAEVNWISSERGIQRPLDPYNPVAWWCPTHDFPNAETLNLMDLARTYHGDFESGMSATDDWVIDTSFGGTRAIDFDGTNDYVDVGSGLFNGWTQMSVSAWFYADALPTRGCVLAQMGSGSDFNFEFGPATSTSAGNEAVITIHDGTTQWKTFTNTAIPTGEWVHLASTWDGTDLKIFLNGLEDSNVNTQGTAGGSIRNVALTTRIGEYERDSEHFDGKVDDIKVYDRWLPPTAIKNLASKRGWTPEETTTITTAGDAAATTIFPFWAIIDNNNSFG